MKPDPILATKVIPAGEDHKHPHTFTVFGGLNYLKGNTAPYFSLTYTEHRQGFPGQEGSGGCNPELILQHFSQFADLAALHLSDMDGVPMHAEANGWYQLAGALGGFGEKYHAGNQKGNYPLPVSRLDPANPHITTEYRYPTGQECLTQFARHCRVTIGEAQRIMAEVDPLNWGKQYRSVGRANATALALIASRLGKFINAEKEHALRERRAVKNLAEIAEQNPGYLIQCKNRWHNICLAMRPRWQAEANACILAHRLKVYGDPWAGPVPAQPPEVEHVPGEAMPRTCHDALPGDEGGGNVLAWNLLNGIYPTAAGSEPELTYVDHWGITSTAEQVDRNPNMVDDNRQMTHWRVVLRRGHCKMTTYFSMGSAHGDHQPTAQEVVDCIAQDAASVDGAGSFKAWARDLGYDTDSRKAHRTYTICQRQGERLQVFLGTDHYAELMGASND